MEEAFAQINPPLFKLKDLLGDSVPGFYYREQLVKTKAPNYNHDYFFVEKVLQTKRVKGEKFLLVKYLYYPAKFNQWISEKNLAR